MRTDDEQMSHEATAALAAWLRSQVMDRVKAQEQLVVVMATLAGVAASFGGKLGHHAELPAVVGLAFTFFALVVLRQDQEITTIAAYLLDESVFGADARAQAGWERHKFVKMQTGGWSQNPATVAQVIAIYGVPLIAGLGFSIAAIVLSPTDWRVWLVLPLTGAFVIFFSLGAADVARRYRDLGQVT